MLYIVGEGIVPWVGRGDTLDSFPLPEPAWLGGRTTTHVTISGYATIDGKFAGAFNPDLGVTTPVFPIPDDESADPATPELSTGDLADLTRYLSTLGVSPRRDLDAPETRRGEAYLPDGRARTLEEGDPQARRRSGKLKGNVSHHAGHRPRRTRRVPEVTLTSKDIPTW